MVSKFLPGSFTKQFGWKRDPQRLHRSIRNGFGLQEELVTRDEWRNASGLDDPDIELIPLNYFLCNKRGVKGDYVMPDTLVEFALTRSYDLQFVKLAVFAFHLANSGTWHNTDWPDGEVAGWANFLVRKVAWRNGNWMAGAFEKRALLAFIQENVEGTKATLQKIRNNYWFMLQQAEIIRDNGIEPIEVNSQWAIAAPQLFWDRQIFDGAIKQSSKQKDFERLFIEHEVYKLMRCSEEQGLAIARAAFRDYSTGRILERFKQIEKLDRLAA